MQIFRVKSVKIYTGQKKNYTDIPVAPVTNRGMDFITPTSRDSSLNSMVLNLNALINGGKIAKFL